MVLHDKEDKACQGLGSRSDQVVLSPTVTKPSILIINNIFLFFYINNIIIIYRRKDKKKATAKKVVAAIENKY